MEHSKIHSVKAVDNHTLIIEFDNHQTKKYNVTPLLEKEMFYHFEKSSFLSKCRS